MALGFAPRNAANRIVATLAMHQAAIAVIAVLSLLRKAEDRPARRDSQQRAQRAQRAAPEARHAKIESHQKNEDQPEENPLPEIWLLEAEHQGAEDEMQDTARRLHHSEAAVLKRVQTRG